MKEIYLNYADGRKEAKITKIINSKAELKILDTKLRDLLDISKSEFLSYSQNATTCLIHSLLPILKSGKFNIYVSSHEIRWVKTLFKTGKLPTDETTYPNYAPQEEVGFVKAKVTVFDPEVFIKNPKKIVGNTPSIVILSHISRMSGEIFANKELYSKYKELHTKNILVIDGSQALGATQVRPQKISDIYIGVTSKFINSEPHIGLCWISKKIVEDYSIFPWSIDQGLFAKEIYSTITSLESTTVDPKAVSKLKDSFTDSLQKIGVEVATTCNQAPHIVVIPWKKKGIETAVEQLKHRGFIVSSNTGYSISEPSIPGIRVSFTPAVTSVQLKKFVDALAEIKK